jgi:hypothetical protein
MFDAHPFEPVVEEVEAVVAEAIRSSAGGQMTRKAEVFLAGVCAKQICPLERRGTQMTKWLLSIAVGAARVRDRARTNRRLGQVDELFRRAFGYKLQWTTNSSKHIPFDWTGP